MSSWEMLLDEALLASVLSEQHARFARPIRDGLAVFLSGLPAAAQAAILAGQASLPATASISERLGLLAQACPVLHKLGQVLARDRRLSPELRAHFRKLESLPASVPLASIERALEQELGPLDRLGVTLTPPALAQASVAVVIPFQLQQQRAPGDDRPAQGVFKVLKPGIEQRLEQELDLLEQVGQHLDDRCADLHIPQLDYQESFRQVRDKLWDEVRLECEQRHLRQAADFYGKQPRVQVPRLLEHCSPRVTAMERIFGSPVTDDHRLDGTARNGLAELVVQALIAQPIFSRSAGAMFHGDPHAGNLFFTDQRRLAMLDWSLVGTLGEAERVAMGQILLGAIRLDAAHLVGVLEGLMSRGPADRPALARVVADRLRILRRGALPGLDWLIGMLDEAVHTAGLRVASDLMLFRKSMHTLQGVVADIGVREHRIDEVLMVEFLRHFLREWPLRWISAPYSRAYATRISNWDLSHTVLSLPGVVARLGMGQVEDALAALRATGASYSI